MSTARKIVERFGGQSALARLLGKGPSTVQHWAKTGTIPAKWQPELLRIAQEEGVTLHPGDFVDSPGSDPGAITRREAGAKWAGMERGAIVDAMEGQLKSIAGGTITSPRGFSAGAVYAGLKTQGQDKLDLALLCSERPCVVGGLFTQNRVVSPTVPLTRQRVARGQAQAIVVNSGCANACVGPQGMLDAVEMASIAARKLGLPEEEVLVASTGIVGVELPMALIRSAIGGITISSPEGGHAFVRAIMTTDTYPKETALGFQIDGKECTIGAVAKGVGMIHPDMATLLCFITTDAAVEPGFLQAALKEAVDLSINMVTVDGDTSTNDMAVVLANGLAGNSPIRPETPEAQLFQKALTQVCVTLTRMVALDGEGATKLIEATVEGAATQEDARRAARAIASSLLVKAAIHGNDPNWGRIVVALGYSGAAVEEQRLGLYINEICVMDEGMPIAFFKDAAIASMRDVPEVKIRAGLGLGEHRATAWGCDLSEEYVRFNSQYTT